MKRKRSGIDSSEIQTLSSLSPTLIEQTAYDKLLQHCLFCYKVVIGSKDAVNNGQSVGEEGEFDVGGNENINKTGMCLGFYRHVKTCGSIQSRRILREEQESLQDLLRANNCGVCEDCFQVIQSHCGIYKEIEYLKLRLRWQVDKIHKIMKYAGKVPSRVKAFKEKFNNLNHGEVSVENDLAHQLHPSFDKVMGLRHNIYDACSKRLKEKNPKVLLTPMEKSNNSLSLDNDASGNEDYSYFCDNNASDNINTNQEEIVYIIKSEDNTDDTKTPTPPESILETLCRSDVPMEGVSNNHYFYCAPVSPTNCDDEDSMSNVPSTSSELANDDNDYAEAKNSASGDLGTLPNSSSIKSTTIYKCVKCTRTFSSEETLICHAKEGNCFTDENICLNYRFPINRNQKNPPQAIAGRSSNDNLTEQNTKNRRLDTLDKSDSVSADPTIVKAPAAPTSRTGNILTNAIDKILLGLGSTFKCRNCSDTFPSEVKYKEHVVARECFREIKKRSSSTGANKNQASCTNDDVEEDSDTSLSTTSTDEESSDSDYAPKQNGKNAFNDNKSRSKSKKVRKEKEMVKAKCPKDNCEKFFLYKKDLERHLKQHSASQLSCQFCPFTTDLASEIANHEIKQHSRKDSDGDILCPRCSSPNTLASDKRQQTEHYIKMHLALDPGPVKNFKKDSYVFAHCKICNKVFNAKSSKHVEFSMKRHVELVHKKSIKK